MTTTKRETGGVFNRRAVLLSGVAFGGLGAVALRIAQLQATDLFSGEWSDRAEENRFDRRVITPPRGVLYDRFGVELATTRRDLRVSIIPEDVDDLEATIGAIAQILELDANWVRRRVREARNGKPYDPLLLRQGLEWDQFAIINARLPELKGVIAEDTETRSYPHSLVFAHPIGYVAKPTQREIDRVLAEGPEGERRAIYLRNPDVRLGKAGIEKALEDVLHGEAGWRLVKVDANGRPVGEDSASLNPPKPGAGIVLTLDADLQKRAMEALGEEAGSAIVMDIYTGDILVMASAPGFDPNLFVNGIGQRDFDALNLSERHPLYHKSVTGTYAPGSTFKMMVGIAARRAGMPEDWAVSCPGYFPFGGRNFHCWRRGGHGRVDMHAAIKGSCDVFFYRAALYAGAERIAQVAREFGFGQRYDLGLPVRDDAYLDSMKQGIVPDPAWWRSIGRGQWTDGLTVNFGIGQGDLQVTPIQLAVMTARLAANGRAVVPRLIREGPGVSDPPAFPLIPGLDPAHLAQVRTGMYGVSNEGGGTALSASNLGLVRHPETRRILPLTPETARYEPVRIAGKTGTAQVRALTAATRGRHYSTIEWKYRDHGLFVCFGPWDEPRYACAVVVEHGGAGSGVAGPIAKVIMHDTILKDPARLQPRTLAQLQAQSAGAPA